jgi:hypothetical protein
MMTPVLEARRCSDDHSDPDPGLMWINCEMAGWSSRSQQSRRSCDADRMAIMER